MPLEKDVVRPCRPRDLAGGRRADRLACSCSCSCSALAGCRRIAIAIAIAPVRQRSGHACMPPRSSAVVADPHARTVRPLDRSDPKGTAAPPHLQLGRSQWRVSPPRNFDMKRVSSTVQSFMARFRPLFYYSWVPPIPIIPLFPAWSRRRKVAMKRRKGLSAGFTAFPKFWKQCG